jgi:hypothetical protein
MKLAEALAQRADIQRRISALRERIQQSVVVQEGETPPEDAQELLNEAGILAAQLGDLITRINMINTQTMLSNGLSITAAIAKRDSLALHYNVVTTAADRAANRQSRYSRTEIRMVATLDVRTLRQQADDLARQRRELDLLIQEANWTIELPE